MTSISPTRDFGVVKTILDPSWSGPWILESKIYLSLRKCLDLHPKTHVFIIPFYK